MSERERERGSGGEKHAYITSESSFGLIWETFVGADSLLRQLKPTKCRQSVCVPLINFLSNYSGPIIKFDGESVFVRRKNSRMSSAHSRHYVRVAQNVVWALAEQAKLLLRGQCRYEQRSTGDTSSLHDRYIE